MDSEIQNRRQTKKQKVKKGGKKVEGEDNNNDLKKRGSWKTGPISCILIG